MLVSRSGRHGLTLAELLVVLCILGVLACLVLPVVSMVLRAARNAACLNNLRQIGTCAMVYAADHNGALPAEGNKGIEDASRSPAWFARLPPIAEQRSVKDPMTVFQCPLFRWQGPRVFSNATPKSYKMNAYLDEPNRPIHYRVGMGTFETETVYFIDAVAGETGMGQWGHCPYSAVDDTRHGGQSVNILYLDGHTGSRKRRTGEAWKDLLRWKPW